MKHDLSISGIHRALAASLPIIDHVTNCCKRPIACATLYNFCIRNGDHSDDSHENDDDDDENDDTNVMQDGDNIRVVLKKRKYLLVNGILPLSSY